MKVTRCRYQTSSWGSSWEWEWRTHRRWCRSADRRTGLQSRWTHDRAVHPSTHGSVGGRWYRWRSTSVDSCTFPKGRNFGRRCRHLERSFPSRNINSICSRIRDHRRRSRLQRSSSEKRGFATMRHLVWLSRSTAGGPLNTIFPLQLNKNKDKIRKVNIF